MSTVRWHHSQRSINLLQGWDYSLLPPSNQSQSLVHARASTLHLSLHLYWEYGGKIKLLKVTEVNTGSQAVFARKASIKV